MQVEKIIPASVDIGQAITYARLAVEENLRAKIVEVNYLGGGSFGKAVGIALEDGSQIVVKMLLSNDMMDKEVFDLRLLADNCSVNFPKIKFVRKADEKIPVDCYAMERIAGKNMFISIGLLFSSKKKRLALADKITSALHEIHECKNSKFGDTMSPDCDSWQEYYKPFATAIFEKAQELYAQGELSEKIIKVMRNAWARYDEIFSQKVQEACLIHGDLNVANIMVDEKDELSGFIDPLLSTYADREYDLFQLDNMTGKRFYLLNTYVNKYGASRNYRLKLAFYALWNEVFCYIRSGVLIKVIMRPLVRNMRKSLKGLD